jgi:hypothetical protein
LEAFFLELPQSRVRELGHPAVGGIGWIISVLSDSHSKNCANFDMLCFNGMVELS